MRNQSPNVSETMRYSTGQLYERPEWQLPHPTPHTPLPTVAEDQELVTSVDVRDENGMEVVEVAKLSPEAEYGAAHARIVATLQQNGAPAPHALASEILNDLTRDGWRRRPVDPAPARPREGAPPSETYSQLRERLAAENAARNAEIARREGRALVSAS